MSFTLQIECDGCRFRPEGFSGTASEIRKRIKETGWISSKGRDYCEECAERERARRLSDPAKKMLDNLRSGGRIGKHLRGQSDHGGASATINYLVKLGLITWDHQLTHKGHVWSRHLANDKEDAKLFASFRT